MLPIQRTRAIKASLTLLALLAIAATAARAGDIMIEQPWIRATAAGAKVAGGYAKIKNMGREADRLIGGSAEGAEKVEVHEMSMENNVMKMRELKDGLAIKPGETVELKPSAYHLMLMGIKQPYTAGQSVKGTLVFAKAGAVPVEFKVESKGAMGSMSGHQMGH